MKITYHKDYKQMHPRLKEILEIVHAKRPLLEYVVTGGLLAVNEATKVEVFQDGQKVGIIDACCRRYSSKTGETTTWCALTSHTIRKERGSNRSTKYCREPKVAARVVLEMFTKRSLGQLGRLLIEHVANDVDHKAERVAYSYSSTLNYSNLALANYFVDIHMGKNPAPPQKIMDQIVAKDMVRMKENMDIAKNVQGHMKANHGYAVKMMQDETLLCAPMWDVEETAKYQSTYDLPPSLQEKFTMLKLLEENQFAADIGIKFKDERGDKKDVFYFIVAGETKVM